MPTYDVESINGTNKGKDLLLANKLWIVPSGAERMLQCSKTRWKNLAMTWINNKKANDMVLQSWIINCLKMYKISGEVINFIEKTMKTWRVELTAGGKSLAETKIQRGDELSSLLFTTAMMPLSHIIRKFTTDTNLQNHRKR